MSIHDDGDVVIGAAAASNRTKELVNDFDRIESRTPGLKNIK